MEVKERDDIKLKLGIAIQTIIKENKAKGSENKAKGLKDHRLVDSLRKLAAASGIDFGNVQKISAGKKNAGITTIVALAEGLDLTLSEFFSCYDKITTVEVVKEKAKKKKK